MNQSGKTAAIISLYGNLNFGNKLQNYAVQEVLKSEGIDTTNICNVPCLNNRQNDIIKVLKFYLIGFIRRMKDGDKIISCIDPNDPRERKQHFLEFNDRIHNSKHFFSFRRLKEFDGFDYYFVGSDQIWNPQYGGLSDLDLLIFTSSKKIAISASFGTESFDEESISKIEQYISKFDAISVRESTAKVTIEKYTRRHDVQVLVDPTMMLSREEWDKVIKKPSKWKEGRYVTCYFLGTETEEYKNAIKDFAERNNCTIVDLSKSSSQLYSSGPSEFVYLIKNATAVFTDSFHASAFSIIYNTPFVVFNRNGKYSKMGSRIDTLLTTFELENARFSGRISDEILNRDYSMTNQILKKERDKALGFVRASLQS